MKIGYIWLILVSLLSGMKEPTKQVLFIGQPCVCMEGIAADQCGVGDELETLLAEREYRWVVVFEPVEDHQALAGYLLRTQPQANIILMEDAELAAKYRLYYAPDCCAVLDMLKKDGMTQWNSGF